MNIFKTIFILFFRLVYSYKTLEEYNTNTMITLVNLIRLHPDYYKNLFDVNYSCDHDNQRLYYPLYYSTELEEAAETEVIYISDPDCTISHDTCYKYCHIYKSCSHIDRINYFCKECNNIIENLIVGPRNVIKALNLFLQSEGHCNNKFNSIINSFGIASKLNPNIYAQTFAYNPKLTNSTYNKDILYYTHVIHNNMTLFIAITNTDNNPLLLYNSTESYIMNYTYKYIYTLSLNISSYNINELEYKIMID